MTNGKRWWVVVAVVAGAACSGHPPPVPVHGAPEAVAALQGEWRGEYWSVQTRRSGSILFRLEAGRDTAMGDVLMIPAGQMHAHGQREHPASEFLAIRVVRVQNDRVLGVLDPYQDPVCGCRLETRFEGTLRGDTIRGRYVSRHLDSGSEQTGEWQVVRVAGAGDPYAVALRPNPAGPDRVGQAAQRNLEDHAAEAGGS